MTASKEKGTRAETGLARYLQANGFPWAERRALTGAVDLGDIAGTIGLGWQMKVGHARLLIPEWLRQTETQRVNAKADYATLVVQPRGVGIPSAAQWWAIKPLWAEVEVYKKAGY